MATARENIERLLRHLGLEDAVVITRELEDRVFGWPVGDKLLTRMLAENWPRDPKRVSERFHGSSVAFREPGDPVPALQVVLHFHPERTWPARYFVELDLDEGSPYGLRGALRHAWQVIRNALTGGKTDQDRIARLLDRRLQRAA